MKILLIGSTGTIGKEVYNHLKNHLKISAGIIKENEGWDCTPIETVDYLQFWLLDSFE